MKTIDEIKIMPSIQAIIENNGPLFDLIIIGAGPAGLSAALYAGRAGLKTLIIEKALIGGVASTAYLIENYPGFPDGISGIKLSQKFEESVKKLGIITYYGEITKIHEDKSVLIEGEKLKAKAIIIASGTETQKLGIPGEDEFRGHGVSYCATCDGPFFRNKNIAVVGGGNSAIEEALFLTGYATKVSIVHRRDKLRADKILAEKALNNPKIFILWNSILEKIEGTKNVESITIKNIQTNTRSSIPMQGVFIYIGRKANSGFAASLVKMDDAGFIEVDENMRTNKNGIFACGDIIKKSLRQIITACSDGAIASDSARRYIESLSF